MRYYYTIFILSVFLYSCKNEKEQFCLKKTDTVLSFPVDYNTKNCTKALFPYKGQDGTEYLTFQNPNKNEILFYNMQSQKLNFKVEPEIEGGNGVGFMWGYYIQSLDSIFLTSRDLEEIYLIDRNSTVKDKYYYKESNNNLPLGVYCSISDLYIPATIINGKMYIIPSCNRKINPNPICATINLKTKEVKSFSASYPKFKNANNEQKRAGVELYMSRCFDGEHFVYSFYYDENIYVASIDHSSVQKVKIKSAYFDNVIVPDDFGKTTFKDMCEIPNYGNILYDSYREIYYRIAYPKTDIDANIRPLELMDYGRKNFSIIILDKNFNKIGETLFPDYTYNSVQMFIREDGLYISESHYLNPGFSDDRLTFRKFIFEKGG